MTDPATPDPYAPPSVPVVSASQAAPEPSGSLETAVQGRYTLPVGDVLRESWERVSGFKGVCLGAVLLVGVLNTAGQMALQPVFQVEAHVERGDWLLGFGMSQLQSIVLWPLLLPLWAGLFALTLRHVATGQPRFEDLFSQFGKLLPLCAMALFSTLLSYLGYALLVLPGIFVSVGVVFSMLLVVDAGLGPWEAITTSIRAVTPHWFSIFGLLLVLGLITMLGTLAFGIGLIWALPLDAIALVVAYRRIFGFHSVSAD